MPWFQQPFFQVALPIVITLIINIWREDKRFKEFKEGVNQRLDEIIKRLADIDSLLREHDRDITTLKERTGLVKVK